jgi:outer membrane receptor protein involved in Fe transport
VYDHWQIHPAFLFAAGMSYDMIDHPDNYRYAPVTEGQSTDDQISPKAGFIWTPTPSSTLRGAWFRALGGVTLDQSIRLEPSQVAGFNQAYRSLIPEAVAGANAAPTFETWAVSLEQKFGRGTFVAVSGELSLSEVRRTVGAVDFDGTTGFSGSGTRERLDYGERELALTLNQLLGDEWAVGAGYRISHAELDDEFPDIPASAAQVGGFQRSRSHEATLHQANLFALYNHHSGFFARSGAIWTSQSNHGYTPDRPGDDFWQFNVEAGWRFAQRRAEVRVGLLNLTDQDYRLNPLNLTQDLPRERTLAVSAQFNF